MKLYVVATSFAALMATIRAFTITSPSGGSYWVEFTSNTISWATTSNDPPTVSLQVINSNVKTLNGVFSIAEYVKASQLSFTVTNVTLVVGDGYAVQMCNPMNASEIYATSAPFSVKPNGTAPAPITSSTSPNGTANNTNNTNSMSTTGGNTHFNGSAKASSPNSSASFSKVPILTTLVISAWASFF
ncbi:hypothetical protein O181_012922 [Austropuccinia psidii MF-1]|uniref:Yeast cell wall synthesis Kre9/Knh1-like N-terminal domain-containing protein n=1 Tax=Austropuccinia psidii MF-1 TaxID=1389203 RepID=A0A9Q3BYL9_9BASI|nr:hypothetical protein [Austropuccinia psidii MF-1]